MEMTSQQFIISKNRQSGQVLIWFLGFAATLAMIFAGVYSIGQATSEKQKIVNAADAAAYSGALIEARALNLASYTNRSIIANEVLIAQMVSLDSWTSYFRTATKTYATTFGVLKNIPYIGFIFAALEASMKALNQVITPIANGLDNGIPPAIKAWELLYTTWYNSTIVPAFTPPVMAYATVEAARNVLSHNVANQVGRIDSAPRLIDVDAFRVKNEIEWQQLTKRYRKTGSPGTSSDDRKYAGELLKASVDEFSKNRPGSDFPGLDYLFGNAGLCLGLGYIGSEKKGGTQLYQYDRWEAQDTLEFTAKVGVKACKGGTGIGAPVGYGRATADQNGATNGRRRQTPGGAGQIAYNQTHRDSGWSGVKELYDVQRRNDGKPQKEEIGYAVAISKEKSSIRNNEQLGFMSRPMTAPTGSPDLKAGFANDEIGAVSEAKIFFSRPVNDNRDITARSSNLFRADRHKEYASLYNPYWQVRLANVSYSNRALAYIVNGLNPLLIFFAQDEKLPIPGI
jgi:Putative Flp pilus-assembly TadE/G-like